MTEYSGTDNLEAMADAVKYNSFLLELVLSHAKKSDCILDFGAGIGIFAHRIAEYGYNVSCVEPDTKQATMIARSGLAVYHDIKQIDDESLDYIYTLNVLEHIEDESVILRALRRKLRPGGLLLIYVPAFSILFSTMDKKVGHYRRYTRKELTALVRLAGFTVVNSAYVDSLGFLATILYKLIGSNAGDLNKKALTAYDSLVFPCSRALDRLFGACIGKNVFLLGLK